MATAQSQTKAPTFAERAAARMALAQQLAAMDTELSTERSAALKGATEAHAQAMLALGFTIQEVAADLQALVPVVPKPAAKPKLPAVYASKDGKQGWSGKGKQPKWLTDAIAVSNGKLDDFKVPATPVA